MADVRIRIVLILAIVGIILVFICLYLIITTYLIYRKRFKYEKMSDDELFEHYKRRIRNEKSI